MYVCVSVCVCVCGCMYVCFVLIDFIGITVIVVIIVFSKKVLVVFDDMCVYVFVFVIY